MTTASTQGFATTAIHAGQDHDPTTGAVIPPVHFSTTYQQDGIANLRNGWEYGRSGNPTRTALEIQLAALEGGTSALSFASGLAAEDALLRVVGRPGGHAVVGHDLYGGTYRLISRLWGPWGLDHTVADATDPDAVRAAIRDETSLIWVETPSNPLLSVVDIAALADIAHDAGALLVVDNTFASPALQRPLGLGADVVVHSVTKYLGGHSDVLGGALVFADPELDERVRFIQFAAGGVSGPLDAWLATRGIKTLDVRMRRHSENAQQVAEHLQAADAVSRVYYPGLPDHPGHALAARQMSGFGGMLSVSFEGGEPAARRFSESLRLFTLAESLGGVESLVNYPWDMTHASVRGTALEVPKNLVRVSVGLESVTDLIADIDQALTVVRS
ncbi:cystathionine gamma-synthase [Propionicicella superfundia]|uniref:cystathionine gamma-synthase n=1 Tax=Propionicicella superfundia TaxID=348582 RepID=UPI00042086DA|nr:cystathionine gamma-synthase [Propionicicella superfundia]